MELVQTEFKPDGEIVDRQHIQSHAVSINEGIIQRIAACFALVGVSRVAIRFGVKFKRNDGVGS